MYSILQMFTMALHCDLLGYGVAIDKITTILPMAFSIIVKIHIIAKILNNFVSI